MGDLGFYGLVERLGIAGKFLPITGHCADLSVIPAGAGATWSRGRTRSFIAGRVAATRALSASGVAVDVVPRCSDGTPEWPAERVGSISHSDTHACAIVARSDAFCGVGVDIEPTTSMERLAELRPLFLTRREQHLTHEEALIAYSAKESLFKAVFPLAREFFGFEDVTVAEIIGDRMTLALGRDIGDFTRGSEFCADFGFESGHVYTVCLFSSFAKRERVSDGYSKAST